MKTYVIDPSVLGGRQPTSMPPTLPAGKPDMSGADLGELVVPSTNPGTGLVSESTEPLPPHMEQPGKTALAAPAPTSAPDPDRAPGGPSTTTSQYSTQGPIPKG